MRGNGENIPPNFTASSRNLERSDRESDYTNLLTVLLGRSLPVFRWCEVRHEDFASFQNDVKNVAKKMGSHVVHKSDVLPEERF